VIAVEADDVRDLARSRLRARQIDLVDDRDDLEVVFDSEVFASVCASTPCDASTSSSAPSHAGSDRATEARRGRACR
jgi:hypothetical protein